MPDNFISTLIDVANQSLSMVGENENDLLTDLDTDTGDLADKVRRFLYVILREIQTEMLWDELKVRVLLTDATDLTEDARYNWGYSYALPDDFCRPWPINHQVADYEIEGNTLLCNYQDEFPFMYQKYSEDPTEWSAPLLKCTYYALALRLLVPVTENDQRYSQWLQEYEAIVKPRMENVASRSKRKPNSRRPKRLDYSRTKGYRV